MEFTGFTCPQCNSDQFSWEVIYDDILADDIQLLTCKDCGWREQPSAWNKHKFKA